MRRNHTWLCLLACSFVLAHQSRGASHELLQGQEKEPSLSTLQELIERLGSPKFSERQLATKALKRLGEPALTALRKAAASEHDNEIRRRSEDLVRVIEDEMLNKMLAEAIHEEEARKDYKKAAEILTRATKLGVERFHPTPRTTAPSDVSLLSDAFLRLARNRRRLAEYQDAAIAYDQAAYYSNADAKRRNQIEQDWSDMLAGMLADWNKSVKEKVNRDPLLRALSEKYRVVILHSRRYAQGDYFWSAYSFVSETADQKKHRNNVQLLFDNGQGGPTFDINMLTNQTNRVADLGFADFNDDPQPQKEMLSDAKEYKAIEGHVYLEEVQDTRGNHFFVVFKIVALDKDSRYMAFAWRRLPGQKAGNSTQ